MKKWAIVLIVIAGLMLACVGIVIVANFAFLRPNRATIQVGPARQVQVNPTGQATSEDVISRNFATGGPAALSLDNAFGDVEIHGQAGLKAIQVKAVKKAWALNPEAAAEILQQVDVQMSQSGDVVTIEVKQRRQAAQNQTVEVNFTISVPENTQVNASTSAGDVALDGVQGAQQIHSAFGNVRASGIGGALTAGTSSGEVTASDIQAGEGNVSLSSAFGDVSLEGAAAAAVTLESKSGELRLTQTTASGGAALKSNFGSITVVNGDFGQLDTYTQSGDIELTSVRASEKVKALSNFGGLRLSQVDAGLYDLATHSGDVRVYGARGKVTADVSQGSVSILDGEDVSLDLRSQSGDLEYTGSLGAGPHTLTSSFGNVRMALPAGSGLDLDLESKFGTIRSDFEVAMGGTLEDNHWVGTVNGGGPAVKVSTSGDIRIESR